VTDRVVGPGGRGVVVTTAHPGEALEDLARLRESGVPAATPADLGLRSTRSLSEDRERCRFWSAATRRPALVRHAGTVLIARPGEAPRSFDGDPAALETAPQTPRVAVFGGAWIGEGEPEYGEAAAFGRLCGAAGVEVSNGGYGGIMAAVSRGAREAGGMVVGVTITSFSEAVPVNRWLTHEVEARDLFARLPLICDAEAWVAFPGGVGTLSEVALCWNLVQTESVPSRPLVIVGERWDRALATFRELLLAEGAHFDLVRPAATAEAAFETARGALGR
jgi:uncharacterized protein (TIGR00730 family)